MTDLLPCPFCGSSNLRYEFCGSQGYIECNECCTQGPCDERAADPICDPGAACDAWNRRAALAQPEPVAPTTPSEWHLLSLEQPSLNALCEYICHANNWGVIQSKGKWHEQTNPTVSGFTNSHGLFVSDPTQTLWRLAQPEPQGPPGRPAIKPVPVAPTNLDAEFRSWYGDRYGRSYFGGIALVECVEWTQFVLSRWGRPAIKPVPVSERLPGPEDTTDRNECWYWHPGEECWDMVPVVTGTLDEWTHWLPHWALPVPKREGER